MTDRITPYKEGGSIEDRIDEIVQLGGRVHFEMMDNGDGWLRIGDEVFWVSAKKNTLRVWWSETRPGYSPPIPSPTTGAE